MLLQTVACSFDNYAYIAAAETGGPALVFDPAEFYPLLVALNEARLTPVAVFCTHHHADHIGGLADLLDEFPGLPVYAYSGDRRRLSQLTHGLGGGETLALAGLEVKVMHTPGHTTGSLCYRLGNHLLTGDTLFGAGCGRIFEGTAEQMIASLATIVGCDEGTSLQLWFGHEYTLTNLRFARLIEPANRQLIMRQEEAESLRGSGKPTTGTSLALELATNPFLRCQETGIRNYLQERGLVDGVSALEVFSALRNLRNNFQ